MRNDWRIANRVGCLCNCSTDHFARVAIYPCRSRPNRISPDWWVFRSRIHPAFRQVGLRHAPQRCCGLQPAGGRARNTELRLVSQPMHPALQDALSTPKITYINFLFCRWITALNRTTFLYFAYAKGKLPLLLQAEKVFCSCWLSKRKWQTPIHGVKVICRFMA